MSARRSTRASNDRVESLAPNLAHVLAVIALAVFAAIHFRVGAGRVAPSSGDASDSKSVSAGFAFPTETMASASASLGSHPAGRKLTVDDLILGCSPLAGIYASSTPERATETVRAALDAGITRFDTAPHYGLGLSERRLGDALRECGADMSKTRVYTKVGRVMKPKDEVTASEKESVVEWGNVPGDPGCIFPDAPVDVLPVLDYTGPGFRRSHADSLARLRLTSVDGLRIHDAEDEARYAQANAGGGVAELVKLRDEGAINEVSLGMNDATFVRRMLEDNPPNTFDSVMMAGAWNLLDQDGWDVLLECERRGVAVHNAGIFASGEFIFIFVWAIRMTYVFFQVCSLAVRTTSTRPPRRTSWRGPSGGGRSRRTSTACLCPRSPSRSRARRGSLKGAPSGSSRRRRLRRAWRGWRTPTRCLHSCGSTRRSSVCSPRTCRRPRLLDVRRLTRERGWW